MPTLGKSRKMTAISFFIWIPSPRGAAGYVYAVSAREAGFRRKQGDLANILAGFRLSGGTGAAPGGQFVS